MAKVNFTKVENAFDKATQKMMIDNLSDLAAIANVIQDPQANLSKKTAEDIFVRFQKHLKKLKKGDPKLYKKLELSQKDEDRFALSPKDFSSEDWLFLKALKLRIDELKKELYGEQILDEENDKQVHKERTRHINKRFNIRDGWLPLH